ncbi:hypothetical protein [Glycomyces terrestris]|uniref:hypothetical protein n=1 Tax=Glycomyces terrestris TaxID=2493553 RepID=UPI0013156081|nr:hypothetical protein [Glycomyces terrestris]
MTTTTTSDSTRNHTRPTSAAATTTGPPGPEMMAEALPFDTVPAEVLRDHFTRWLVESLTRSALQAAAAAAIAAEANPPEAETPAPAGKPPSAAAERHLGGGPDDRQTPAAAALRPPGPEHGDTGQAPPAVHLATTEPSPAIAESPTPPLAERKPKRPKSKNRPSGRKREGPLADAMDPPPPAPISGPSRNTGPFETEASASSGPPWLEPAREAGLASEEARPSSDESPPSRPQYVRIGDRSVWLTKPMLRSRGWTEAAIRDFLPGPEALKPNPRFAVSGAPMPVWRPRTVARAEADPKWREWLDRSLHRRQTTLEALAATDDLEFRSRLELADQAIRDCSAPPTLLDELDSAAATVAGTGSEIGVCAGDDDAATSQLSGGRFTVD